MQVTSGFVQLDDLFTAGIGCDLAGAWLLARGLIATPEQLTRFSTAFWDSNRYLAINVAKNRTTLSAASSA